MTVGQRRAAFRAQCRPGLGALIAIAAWVVAIVLVGFLTPDRAIPPILLVPVGLGGLALGVVVGARARRSRLGAIASGLESRALRLAPADRTAARAYSESTGHILRDARAEFACEGEAGRVLVGRGAVRRRPQPLAERAMTVVVGEAPCGGAVGGLVLTPHHLDHDLRGLTEICTGDASFDGVWRTLREGDAPGEVAVPERVRTWLLEAPLGESWSLAGGVVRCIHEGRRPSAVEALDRAGRFARMLAAEAEG
jgi:hypothetical protein